MNFKILIDNNLNPFNQFRSEHGLSVYFEFSGKKCLIDTGQSECFLLNAQILNVSINDIDILFISHGHFDHVGGLEAFLVSNSKAKIVISENALNKGFFSYRQATKRNIGKDLSFVNGHIERFIFVKHNVEVLPGLFVLSNILKKYPTPKANKILFKFDGNLDVIDDFDHEIIVCALENSSINVYTGCGHSGILNILSDVERKFKNQRIQQVVGGFHLLESDTNNRFETEEEILKIGGILHEHYPETNFFTGHCTSDYAIKLLESKMNSKIKTFYSGFELKE